jgi:lysozyme
VLLCFNIGIGGFTKSTVLKCHNRGDHQAAARAFGLWNKSSGVVYAGLTRRRAEESALYLTPMPDDVSDPVSPSMPQRIDPESSMAASPINRAGVVAGGTATVAAVSEASRLVSDVKYSVSSLGDWLLPVLLLCVVGFCAYMIWQRVQQRKGGWV